MAGPLPRSRLTGTIAGIKEVLPGLQDSRVVFLDGNGQSGHTLETVRKRLRLTKAEQVLVGAIDDPTHRSLARFRRQGAVRPARRRVRMRSGSGTELRRKGTRPVGSVAYFPERYDYGIIPLALDMLRAKPVPPAVFVKHRLITPENVDQIYPNDGLLAATEH